MKRTELKRRPMKRTQVRRDWSLARAKCEQEELCRCGPGYGECEGKLEAAHIIGRERDRYVTNPPWDVEHEYVQTEGTLRVAPSRIVPLCTKHHRMYDAHELDIVSVLTTAEQIQAVLDTGTIEAARRRLCPTAYRTEAA